MIKSLELEMRTALLALQRQNSEGQGHDHSAIYSESQNSGGGIEVTGRKTASRRGKGSSIGSNN